MVVVQQLRGDTVATAPPHPLSPQLYGPSGVDHKRERIHGDTCHRETLQFIWMLAKCINILES